MENRDLILKVLKGKEMKAGEIAEQTGLEKKLLIKK